MRMSELMKFTSGKFTWRSIWNEAVEFKEAETWPERWEEAKDTVTTALLWLYANHGIDVPWPSFLSSASKYIDRIIMCQEILVEEGIYDEERHQMEPFYWAKYTHLGSNMERPHKRASFIASAFADRRVHYDNPHN